MKAVSIIHSIAVIILLSTAASYGQSDSARLKAITILSQHLKADTSTAGKVINIQSAYKTAVKKVIVSTSLTDQQKRTAIDSLIDVKNRQLEQVLTPRQRELVVPTSERRRNWKPDTTANKIH